MRTNANGKSTIASTSVGGGRHTLPVRLHSRILFPQKEVMTRFGKRRTTLYGTTTMNPHPPGRPFTDRVDEIAGHQAAEHGYAAQRNIAIILYKNQSIKERLLCGQEGIFADNAAAGQDVN
jgi:hypothetical protein